MATSAAPRSFSFLQCFQGSPTRRRGILLQDSQAKAKLALQIDSHAERIHEVYLPRQFTFPQWCCEEEDTQMDPSPPTVTGHSPRNEADTPQTCDLKDLRAKRVAYYKSIGIIKGDSSKIGNQPVSSASQDTKGKHSENQNFNLGSLQKSPHYSASGKEPIVHEESQVVPGEAEQDLGQMTGEGHRRRSCPMELDFQMLADPSVPETQKLQHVINWAQKFLSNSPEEQGLKSPRMSLGHLHSNLCQSAEAVGSQKDVHLRSSVSSPLLRGDQASPRIDLHNFSLRPPENLSEMDLSSEFPHSFLKLSFLGKQSHGCQETTVKNERERRAAGSPANSFKQTDSAQQKCDRAGNTRIQNPDEEDTFPERLRIQAQIRDTSEERKVLEETGQSPPRNGYFWTPLSDSSEEECLDGSGDSESTFRRGVQGRKCEEFVGFALSSTHDSTPVSQTTMLESDASSPGDTPLEADRRGHFRGAAPTGTPKDIEEESKVESSRGFRHMAVPKQGLSRVQFTSPCDSSKGRGKESDHMKFSLGSPHSHIHSKNKWKCGTMEREGGTFLGRVPRGSQSSSVPRLVKGSPPFITQRQLDLTHPEGSAPQVPSLLLNSSEDPSENVLVHKCWDSDVFHEPAADSHSSRFSESSPAGAHSLSVQTHQVITRKMSQEQKEKTVPSSHHISRGISKIARKGSFPCQDIGDGPSWSVLETYVYYLHMLDKIRGHSSEEENSSLPFQRTGLSESESMITSLKGKGRFKGAGLDRNTKGWKDECESDVAMDGEGDTDPQAQGCAEEGGLQETSFWKPQGNYGSVVKFFCKNVPQDVKRETEERERDAVFSRWLLLPDEIWICILSLLPHKELARVAQVCHRFHRLVSDKSLWKQIQIAHCPALKDEWLLALGCRHPRSLTLHRCSDVARAVTGDGLKSFFQLCGDFLQELNLTSCSGPGLTGDKVLLQAGALCRGLTAVDISWSGATDVGVMALIEGASSLQGLSINGCQITDKAIKALIEKHGNSLRKLEVFGCFALTARSIGSLALRCSQLRTLNIGRVPKVSEACLVRSLKNLQAITALNVTGLKMVRDRIVHLIVTQCPKLDSLVLSSCSQVTDMSLVEISTYLRTLRYLDVSGCQQVTNVGLNALARSCHQLKYLDLSSTGINKRGVCLLANYCHISLECVKLSFCKNITLDVVKKLCKNCRRLKILHLYGCTITPGLSTIKEAYKRVKVFHDFLAPTG
ncbi:uncharacterized protein LOC143657131 [Tamandua tetradactyla]|uniref:uncharacterized protein LOC143657131 n=1 Tax=Tamandua tetradactyla TaxID=48850 RepID=UPI0040545B59